MTTPATPCSCGWLVQVPLGQDRAVQGGTFGLEERYDHLVLRDLHMNKATQRWGLTGEELDGALGNVVPVTDVGVQEVPGTAHHVADATFFNVLQGNG